MTMKDSIAFLALLALLTAPASAFQQPARPSLPLSALHVALRDMASYPDGAKMMSEFEAFDRNGAFSRSPQGGASGRMDMMYGGGGGGGPGGNPFAHRSGGGAGGGGERMYTRDGFDPYSAYGNSFGISQSEGLRGPPRGGMDYYGGGPNMMMMGGRGGEREGMMNGVKADNTMGGFAYSSHNTDYGYGPPPWEYYQDQPFEGGGMMMGGGYHDPMGGGMSYEQGYHVGRGEYGGFDGDMGRRGP